MIPQFIVNSNHRAPMVMHAPQWIFHEVHPEIEKNPPSRDRRGHLCSTIHTKGKSMVLYIGKKKKEIHSKHVKHKRPKSVK